MTLRAAPLSPALTEVSGALHRAAGFAEPWSADSFANLLATPGTAGVLALDDDQPLGLVLWRMAADEAEILTLGVPPEHRRRGIGRFLLEAASAAMRESGVRRLFLEVAVDNVAAIALYRSLDFRPAGRRPGYYRGADGPVDALILAREYIFTPRSSGERDAQP
jgi:ribosomal-protein-alanine N-acetyltransferase